jgi:hypothetical protein
MDLTHRQKKRHTSLKMRHRPTATKNKDRTGHRSTSGKIHDCFMMMMMTTMTMMVVVVVVIMVFHIST